jgi:lactoylglutathione lyase
LVRGNVELVTSPLFVFNVLTLKVETIMIGRIATALLLSLPITAYQQQPAKPPTVAVTINHVALNVADLDVSVAFYSDVFGLEEIPAAAKGRRWMSLGKGIELHLLGGRTAPVADNRSVHLALTSDNLDPIIQRLKARGIAWSDFAGAPGAVATVRTDGVRQIFLRDPDGYWIEVNDALKNRPR